MKSRLILFVFVMFLFALPGKAQKDTGKNGGNVNIINFGPVDTSQHSKTDNYRRSNNWLYSISTDLAQDAFFQPNLGADYKLNKSLSLGLNIGYLIPAPLFAVNPLANGQFTDPGTVYRGLTLRLNLKYYFNEDKPKNYIGFQAVYKYLIIADEQFTDDYGDEAYNTYEIHETTNTIGADFILGRHTGDKDSKVSIDFFLGIGAHFRIRNYTVFNDNSFGFSYTPPGTPGYTPPAEFEGQPIAYDGTYNVVTPIFALVLGAKFEIKYFKKQ